MKKRFILVFFIIIIASLAVVYFYNKNQTVEEVKTVTPKNVSPQVSDTSGYSSENFQFQSEDAIVTSMVPLLSNETLLSVVSQDFDGDGFEDQVNAIKTTVSPYISLLVGLYNPQAGAYERSTVIQTKIIRTQTFAFMPMDLTGEHKTSLVYTGITETGENVLQAFYLLRENGQFRLKMIADFEADGTIFINQLDRYDQYERTVANGLSFPIWVYKSDTSEKPDSLDQLQIQYDWDSQLQIYTEVQRIRVPGSKIVSKELSRILDGKEETIGKFLTGFWYKKQNDGKNVRYLYFDYETKEIIFLYEDTEEVYNWLANTVRRNGMYISSVNQVVENLQRSLTITLLGIDSINLRVKDDVRMIIGENPLWDGEYRKQNMESLVLSKPNSSKDIKKMFEAIENCPAWKNTDGTVFTFENGIYEATGTFISEKGRYAFSITDGFPYIQLRADDSKSTLNGTYQLSYATYEEEITTGKGKNKKTQIVTRQNPDSIILQACTMNAEGTVKSEKAPLVIVKSSTGND